MISVYYFIFYFLFYLLLVAIWLFRYFSIESNEEFENEIRIVNRTMCRYEIHVGQIQSSR